MPIPPEPLRLGPDTSIVTGPLLPDGTLDLAGRLSVDAAAGHAATDNFIPSLAGILGPDLLDDPALWPTFAPAMGLATAAVMTSSRSLFLDAQLSASTSPAGNRFPALRDDEVLEPLLGEPWYPASAPEVVAWLNATCLAEFTVATRAPAAFWPTVLPTPHAPCRHGLQHCSSVFWN